MTTRKWIDASLALSDNDQKHLYHLEKKLQLVRDRTAAVVHHTSTGFLLSGAGGVGKSYTVLGELEHLKADYTVHNSHMTGKGLYEALEAQPDAVHLFEDMEAIMKDKAAQGVLRSACWGQRLGGADGRMVRTVTWTTSREQRRFVFNGGIIVTSNRPLTNLPELQAIATRIVTMHLQVSRAELVALMRSISLQGYEGDDGKIDPQECMEVCEYIAEQTRTSPRPLDMRVLIKSFQDYLQWEKGDAGCNWHDLVSARLNDRLTAFTQPVVVGNGAERKAHHLEAAKQVLAASDDHKERLALWKAKTGSSQATMYRCFDKLREVTAVA